MASTPPTSERVPTAPPSTKGTRPAEKRARKIRLASDDEVKAAVKRVTRDHRDLVKDLAK